MSDEGGETAEPREWELETGESEVEGKADIGLTIEVIAVGNRD